MNPFKINFDIYIDNFLIETINPPTLLLKKKKKEKKKENKKPLISFYLS
jgi:hypothetical protein